MGKPLIKIIAAVSLDGFIGKDGQIPWRLPSDLKKFKELTLYSTVVMGRKTWESLPNRPLKDRRNIVLSQTGKGLYGVERYTNLSDAIEACSKEKEIWLIGGETVYREGLKLADEVYLTKVLLRTGGDASFDMSLLEKNFRPKESSVVFEENDIMFTNSRWAKQC